MTDNPWAHLVLEDGGARVQVDDYEGCRKAPQAVRLLELNLQSLLKVERWIGTESDPRGKGDGGQSSSS